MDRNRQEQVIIALKEKGDRSRGAVLVISMIQRFMGADILAILATIKIATYCFRKGYSR